MSPRFPKAPPSLAFFQDIAKFPRDEYVRQVITLTPEQAVEHMLTYNHTLSTIVVAKYRQLRLAIVLFRVAFACWLVLGAVLVRAAL
ncbi:MAG TPA: Pycsar system effector family protein [Tepidisphaeraceae bacterium]|nr:Pycsar system effector family protein [Tepidisphaeraceae bacterium]